MTTTAADALRVRLHDPDRISGSQKLMIMILSMTLYGVADIVADLLPKFEVGSLELEVAYFAFIPVVLAALLTPLWVALGVAIGEAVIADMLLGSFSGIGELEGFLQIFVGTYVAGCLVKDPRRPARLFWAAMALVSIDKVSSGIIDVAKFGVGIDPEAGEDAGGGLAAVVLAEGIELVLALVITGAVFGGLVAIWLAPRLYGKIEPLMGLRPRDPANPPRLVGPWGSPFWLVGVLGIVLAAAVGIFEQWEEHFEVTNPVTALGEWEAANAESLAESSFAWLAALLGLVAGLVIVAVIAALRARGTQRSLAADADDEAEDDA
ncbi:cell division protein FtsQ [Myceligenerans pegani]|uniref:Cell division protein FtsQ n=1 Tax=Myceligenerans pegani TaxID=2776917 RepID=A0ABR9MXI8_9MICO|nr:cell division protein FtsQ [Myceligenerans sp. TRM 65318]MBE1875721.1 cell division protein FtsQ [Myceligenerans sp. TRM 65318]MBE3017992.1 cell division protein FtsQ [Myceligenerans sp. TRM 65318]